MLGTWVRSPTAAALTLLLLASTAPGLRADPPVQKAEEFIRIAKESCEGLGSAAERGKCYYKQLRDSGWLDFIRKQHVEGCLATAQNVVASFNPCAKAMQSEEGNAFARSMANENTTQDALSDPTPPPPPASAHQSASLHSGQAKAQQAGDAAGDGSHSRAEEAMTTGFMIVVASLGFLAMLVAGLAGAAAWKFARLSRRFTQVEAQLQAQLEDKKEDGREHADQVKRIERETAMIKQQGQVTNDRVDQITSRLARMEVELSQRSLDRQLALSYRRDVETPAVATAPAAAQMTAPEAERLVSESLRNLADAGTPITQANATARIAGCISDTTVRDQLIGLGLSAELFDAEGNGATQGAELVAVRFKATSKPNTCLVYPMPQAGRVGRFINWFDGAGDYKVNPVLALKPAIGVLSGGMLTKSQAGRLR